MIDLVYRNGDATAPHVGSSPIIVAHIVNDIGAWGAGFVLAVSRRWPEVRSAYYDWRQSGLSLGSVQFVKVEPQIIVANMCGQTGVGGGSTEPPIRYWALQQCLEDVRNHAILLNADVHMPFIGCGLAGGSWDKIRPLVENALSVENIPVVVYDFNNEYSEFTKLPPG